MATAHYHGSCQCGDVSFEVDADLDHTIICNCSRCKRLGSTLAFAPRERFTLLSGEDKLAEYLFNKHKIHHLFCSTCGIKPFAYGKGRDGEDVRAVNVRCLDDVDLGSIATMPYDGRSK